MGYFNYFLKCVIRNITYRLCKPKTLLFLLVFVIIISFCSFAFAADSTVEVEGQVITNPTEFDSNNNVNYQYDNQFLTLRRLQEQAQINFINKMYVLYGSGNRDNAKYVASLFMNDLLYSAVGTRYPLVIETQEGFKFGTYNKSDIMPKSGQYGYYYPYQNITGAISFTNVSYSDCTLSWRYMTYNNALYPVDGVVESYSCPSAFFNVYVEEWIDMFIHFGLINTSEDADIIEKLEQIINSNENASIKDAIEQGNHLQEEQNQIQKEQNDFLKQDTTDSDVSIDSFNSVDSNDITSSGLTGIFNNIYNSINSWNSKDINLPVPFTNKTINIQANYTSNMLNKVGRSNFN